MQTDFYAKIISLKEKSEMKKEDPIQNRFKGLFKNVFKEVEDLYDDKYKLSTK